MLATYLQLVSGNLAYEPAAVALVSIAITTVYVTHDQEEALSLSDRIVVMSEGHIEQIGTPFHVYKFPETPFVATFNNPHLALPERGSAVTFSFPPEACLVLDSAGREVVAAAATAI